MSEVKKPSFWQRLFGGTTATTDTPEPKADAQGNVSFTAEQFGKLTSHLESLEAKETAYTEMATRVGTLEATVTAHGERMAKLATLPAETTAATSQEPKAATGDEPTAEADPLDAELKALQK